MNEIREHRIGVVSHWYSRLGVATIELDEDLHIGDRVHVIGHTTDVMQPVYSMQIDHHWVNEAHPGDPVAVKMGDHVREHDDVYLVEGVDEVG